MASYGCSRARHRPSGPSWATSTSKPSAVRPLAIACGQAHLVLHHQHAHQRMLPRRPANSSVGLAEKPLSHSQPVVSAARRYSGHHIANPRGDQEN